MLRSLHRLRDDGGLPHAGAVLHELSQHPPRFGEGRQFFHQLSQEMVNRLAHLNGDVDRGIRPAVVSADRDQILILSVRRHNPLELHRILQMVRRNDVGHGSTDAFENVDGGKCDIAASRRDSQTWPSRMPRTVSETISFISSASTSTVYGPRNAAARRQTGAFEQTRHHREDGGRIAFRRRRFAGAEPRSRAGHRQPGGALIIDTLLCCGRGNMVTAVAVKAASDAQQRGSSPVAQTTTLRRSPSGPRLFSQKLANFAAALADEPDNDDLGFGIASDHAKRHAFADAGAREDAETLAFGKGEQGIDRSDARFQRFGDLGPFHGTGRLRVEAHAVRPRYRRPPVADASGAVENAPEHRRSDGQLRRRTDQADAIAAPHAAKLAMRGTSKVASSRKPTTSTSSGLPP